MDKKWDAKRILTVCLGGFWLLDGILQLQPAMFTNVFVGTVLSPNLQNQPGFIASIIAFGIHIWNIDPFLHNLLSALVQLLIGVLLILPFRDGVRRYGLWLSIAWALVIWVFGEGFGNLATGSATFYTGAPGSALLYLILALFLLYSSKGLSLKKLPIVAGIIFLIGTALNLSPMFWQPGMSSMLAMTTMVSGPLGMLGTEGTFLINLLAISMLACFGILLIFMPTRSVAWATIVFLLLVWWFGQSFGGLQTFPNGTATDPNSAPLFILFLLPIFFGEEWFRIKNEGFTFPQTSQAKAVNLR